jgi:ribonucleoside-diphosphate reductase alpha chain
VINKIIKRNGTQEDFLPSKVNGWSEWAAKKLGSSVDWGAVVIDAVNQCPEICTSEQLQQALINVCLSRKTWEYNRMAGRLYVKLIDRIVYPDGKPTVKQLHEKLHQHGLMVKLNYDDQEYEEVEQIINHKQDLLYPHFQLNQLRFKYALRNKVTGQEFESAQFVYMRMAMALAENEPADVRMTHLAKWYDHFSKGRLNVPTPGFVNLGTQLNGYASCCLYTTDDTWPSLAAGDHIAYVMTCMSAGIGSHIKTRSVGDPVRGGLIAHAGKLPYYRAMVGAIGANLQNGRGGSSTVYYTAYDPEVEVIQKLRHPMTPQSKRIAGCHYSFGSNKLFARKVAMNEQYAPFSYYDNKQLFDAQYSADEQRFEQLYNEWEAKAPVKLNARDVLLGAQTQAYETGVQYLHMTDALNTHTPFNDTIWMSNLCAEIAIPQKPFKDIQQLYKPEYEDGDGEIGLCSLAGIIVPNIESDQTYADVAYYALKMIDVFIHKSDYVFPNLGNTAKARLSAGVGIIGLAHLMAKEHKKYDTQDGRDFIHELAETHIWHLINASLRLGKELGNAPWIDKTKWPQGWLPIDTYEKRVDQLVTTDNKRDWESLRKAIVENGGIRNSVVAAHMPGESSTIGAGTTNGLYPIREISIMKTNDTLVNHWVAPDSTKLKDRYQRAWEISTTDMIKVYSIIQKWTDQGISADLYVNVSGDQKVSSAQVIRDYLDIVKYGMKTRYYVVSLTSKGIDLNKEETAVSASTNGQQLEAVPESSEDQSAEGYCESCSL